MNRLYDNQHEIGIYHNNADVGLSHLIHQEISTTVKCKAYKASCFFKVAVAPKRSTNKLETNYHDRIYENCHISASTAPRHLKIGKERELI